MPALSASAAASAMKGGACFMPANTGSPSRPARARACARVISVSGEPRATRSEERARTAVRDPKHAARAPDHTGRRSEKDGRVEVALHTSVVTHALPSLVQVDAPVERDDVRAGFCDQIEKPGGRGPEVDSRYIERRCGFEDAPRERQHPLFVVAG